MIIFDNEKYLKDIKNNGISANDKNARFKLNYLISDMLQNTTYRKSKVIEIAKNISSDFFYGLPDFLINKELAEIYDDLKENVLITNQKTKTITLYESEMQTITSLKDDKLVRLAFTALLLFKYTGQFIIDNEEKYYKAVKLCEADIYRIADFDSVSGSTKKKLFKQLSDLGLIKFSVKTNPAWKYHPDWLAITLYSMPFCVDLKEDKTKEKIYRRVTNYDDPLLYLRSYQGANNIIECADCGAPISKTSNARCLCNKCAEKRKKTNDKTRYQSKIAIA